MTVTLAGSASGASTTDGSVSVMAAGADTAAAFSVPPSESESVTVRLWYFSSYEAPFVTATLASVFPSGLPANHFALSSPSYRVLSAAESRLENTSTSASRCPPYKLLRSHAKVLHGWLPFSTCSSSVSIETRWSPSGNAVVAGAFTFVPSR